MSRFRYRFNSRKNPAGDSKPLSLGGKIFGSLFFAVFLLMGLFFSGLLGKELIASLKTYSWTRADCSILKSEVIEDRQGHSGNPYVYSVEYKYVINGRNYTSSQYALNSNRFSRYNKASKLVAEFPAGGNSTCLVNPSNPEQAILKRGSLVMGFFLIIPLVFVVLGGGGIYFIWKAKMESESSKPKSISEKASGKAGFRFLFGFFSLFLLVGIIVFYFMMIRPVSRIIAAKSWVETPCVVLNSQVRSHDSDDGTTYSVDIFYQYTYKGHDYKSDRYHFMGGSSSGYSGKAAVVRQYPAGKKTICFVNPNDPADAVLERRFTPDLWFGLFPLIFVFAGAGGMVYAVKSNRARTTLTRLASSSRRSEPELPSSLAGPVTLKPTAGPILKFMGAVFIAAFWNGIVSLFVTEAVKAWQRDRPDWFLMIFLIPFVLAGLALIGFIGYTFLALFNPRPRLTVNSKFLALGGDLEIQWKIPGRTRVINTLEIYLEGREEATYRRGTRSYTDKNTFTKIPIFKTRNVQDMKRGSKTVFLPRDTVPSFSSTHNKIVWTIHARGDIKRWPDVNDEFVVNLVDPQSLKQT